MVTQHFLSVLLAAATMQWLVCPAMADSPPTKISRIEAGAIVRGETLDGWSHVVLMATPKVTSGDVGKVSQTVLGYASMFATVIAADVTSASSGYQFLRIGVGLAVRDGDGFRIVSTQSPQEGDDLGLIARQVLSAGERSLDQLTISLSHSTAVIVDSPAIVSVGGKHRTMKARHLIWVQPASGSVTSAVWFIQSGSPATTLNQQAALLPAGFREQRRLHVDEGEFLFGIPGGKAFAMERLPPGKTVTFKDAVQRAACVDKPTLKELGVIAECLSAAAAQP